MMSFIGSEMLRSQLTYKKTLSNTEIRDRSSGSGYTDVIRGGRLCKFTNGYEVLNEQSKHQKVVLRMKKTNN